MVELEAGCRVCRQTKEQCWSWVLAVCGQLDLPANPLSHWYGEICLAHAGYGVCVCPEQVSEVGLGEEVLAVPPSHKGVSRRLIFTSAHGLVELPSSLSWLFRTRPPFSGPLLPAVLAEIFR